MNEEMSIDVTCLACGGLLFKKVPLDNKGNWAMDVETPARLEHDGTDSFYKCLNCSAKNVVVDTTTPTGLPATRISHVKKD